MQSMNRNILLLSILFLLPLFFYLFDISQKTSITFDFHQKDFIKLNLTQFRSIQNDSETYIFSKSIYLNQTRKPSENVIAFLVASFSGDARLAYNPYPRLREKVLQLNERLDDNCSADIIIFHTGYPFREDLLTIIKGSCRHVEFVNIDQIFYKLPSGFDPHIRDPTWTQRGKWNYHHMCNFWFKQVFETKILQQYRYMMRLDDDSQILGKWPHVFDLMVKHKAIYMANKREMDFEYILPGLTLIRNVTAAYIARNQITVQNPVLFADIFSKPMEIPNYWNNFEIVDLSFMQRKEIIDFIQVIDESKGIFLYRWGDAPLRHMMLAIFAKPTQVLHREELKLAYCHPC